LRRALIIVAVMAAAFIPIVDSTIANVAIPHMQSALGATADSITWVLTFYMLALGVATPITGWIETRMGRRKMFTLSVAGFTLSSALCGSATSLEMMVFARALQGIFGAFIAPLAQATMLDSSPPNKHTQAMTIWGGGIMLAPIMGPVLGGWLTENMGWRWVFYVNLPIGILATFALWSLIEDVPTHRSKFDLKGFLLIAGTLTALQLMLDRGSQLDWFDSTEIQIEAAITLSCLWMLIIHIFTEDAPIIPRALFQDRNFIMSTLFTIITAAQLMALSALIAPMLQRLMGYDAMLAGEMMVPRGIGGLISVILAGHLASRFDTRIIVAFGFVLTGISTWMLTGLNLEADGQLFISSGVLQGFAISLTFMPLNLLAFSTISAKFRTSAASVFNLARNIGGSVIISVTSALLVYNVQVNHEVMAGKLSLNDLLSGIPGLQNIPRVSAGLVLADAEINRQATMIAYIDNFVLLAWMSLVAIPFLIFLKPLKRTNQTHMMMSE
jgi:MFS transporter, DHA2 family, multidrug resistance protein